MTKKEFMNKIVNNQEDILQQFLDLINSQKIDYCVIGGLAVNAYAEPVVSLDLDIVVAVTGQERLVKSAGKVFVSEKSPHRIKLTHSKSDLRIQLQINPRYQEFIKNASIKDVMGYKINVAALEDVLQGKIWAYSDEKRRASKRQKDLADIFRLVETYPKLKSLLPKSIKMK